MDVGDSVNCNVLPYTFVSEFTCETGWQEELELDVYNRISYGATPPAQFTTNIVLSPTVIVFGDALSDADNVPAMVVELVEMDVDEVELVEDEDVEELDVEVVDAVTVDEVDEVEVDVEVDPICVKLAVSVIGFVMLICAADWLPL